MITIHVKEVAERRGIRNAYGLQLATGLSPDVTQRLWRGEWEKIGKETDGSDLMEGLYLKVEAEGEVRARYKYVRADFLTAVVDSGTHWLRRPIVPNMVAAE